METSQITPSTEPIISKDYPESGFTSIANKIDGDIDFKQESPYSIVVSAQQFILDIISVQVTDSQLVISYLRPAPPHLPVSIAISSPTISGISVFSSGNFSSGQAIESDDLNLLQSGSGDISLASYTGQSLEAKISSSGDIVINGGSVSSDDLTVSGSGDMLLSNLVSEDATLKISASGDIKVNVTKTLNIKISGSGDVYYSGTPAVSSKITGSGKVIHVK
jgi:hypothetical protein